MKMFVKWSPSVVIVFSLAVHVVCNRSSCCGSPV